MATHHYPEILLLLGVILIIAGLLLYMNGKKNYDTSRIDFAWFTIGVAIFVILAAFIWWAISRKGSKPQKQKSE